MKFYLWSVGNEQEVEAQAVYASGDGRFASGLGAELNLIAPVPAEEPPPEIEIFAVAPAFPNPFQDFFRYNIDIPEDGRVRTALFNARGRIISDKSLFFPAGRHRLSYSAGTRFQSGSAYVLMVEYKGRLHAQQVVLIR